MLLQQVQDVFVDSLCQSLITDDGATIAIRRRHFTGFGDLVQQSP